MRSRLMVGAVALALLTGACGLGDKEAQADRIINAGKNLMRASSVSAAISAQVNVLPVERQLVTVELPRIAPGGLPPVGAALSPTKNSASVAGVLVFTGDAMYQRISPSVAVSGSEVLGAVPSNLASITAVATGVVPGQGFRDEVTGAYAVVPTTTTSAPAATTTSTTAARSLRRTVQIVREWAAFDFADIPDDDRTKHGGSFAINPVALLRLTTGVLTGSVERRGDKYEANVSRDKAERNLSEDEREVLDKMFTANAITRRVFPAKFVFDGDRLAAFEVRLRQQLSSKDRADLTIFFVLGKTDDSPPNIKKPARRGTVNVSSLGQLVTTVSGT